MANKDIVLDMIEIASCGKKLQTATEGIQAQIEEITPEGNLEVWNSFYEKYREMAALMGCYKALLIRDRVRINGAIEVFLQSELEVLK